MTTSGPTIPFNTTEEGALILWPEDLAVLVFGPGLTLAQVAQVEAMMAAAADERRRYLDAEEARAKVVVLADRRQQRAVQHRPSRGVL